MTKKIIIGISTIIIVLFLGTVIYQNYLIAPISAYESKNVWKKHEKEVSLKKKADSILKFPKPIGYVNDFENIFTSEQRIKLDKTIGSFEIESTNEIAIVTIQSIEPYNSIKKYATELSNEWGIGKSEKNNGLLILFSKSLREIQISTGTGTEKILTDEICKKVIDQIIIPEFKKGDFHSGIKKGLDKLITEWK